MNSKLKKIAISLLAILLVYTQLFFAVGDNPIIPTAYAQEEGITLEVGLKDTIHTKSERITFDVWARDANNQKIDDDYVTVTNNDSDVGINWTDEVKTSYTAYLTEGTNNINVHVSYEGQELEKDIVVEYEFAEYGEVIGEFTFSMDGFVVGIDYLIEPIKIPIINGENAAIHLERILEEHGFTTSYTGSLEGGYYLSTIHHGNLLEKTPNIPQAIFDAVDERGGAQPDPNEYNPEDGLGEFNFNYMSGWMYAVNNVFPNVGFSDYYLMNDDIMRVQFTVAYGSDIGGYAMGGNEHNQYFPQVNKDSLTEIVATINSSSMKEILLNNSQIATAYENSLEVLRIVDATQVDLNEAEAILRNLYGTNKIAALIKAIEKLPAVDKLSVTDRTSIELIRYDLNKLSTEEVAQITNLAKLEEVEAKLQEVVLKHNQQKAQVVIDAIKTLPAEEVATIEDEKQMLAVVAQYDALTEEQKLLVTNVSTLNAMKKQINALILEVSKKAAQPIIDLIAALPDKNDITLEHESQIDSVNAQYQKLTQREKAQVSNFSKLNSINIVLRTLLQAEAKVVTNAISALPKFANITLEHKMQIVEVRAKYEVLTTSRKQYVTSSSLNTLIKAEEKIAQLENEKIKNDQLQAQKVIDKIAALLTQEAITLADEVAVNEVKAAYEALTAKQKELVTNANIIAEMEEEIAKLKEEKEANVKAAQVVMDQIAELPSKEIMKLTDEAALKEAQTAYTALTKEQKELVTNAAIITELAEVIAKLKEEANIKVAQAVMDQIAALPSKEKMELTDETALKEAQTTYASLSKEQKELVTNAAVLTELTTKLKELKEEAAIKEANLKVAQVVMDQIKALPSEENMKLTDEAALKEAQEAYVALSKDQKALVTNAIILTELTTKLAELKGAEGVEDVTDLIASLPDVSSLKLTHETALQAVKTAYDGLTVQQKKFVTNSNKLTNLVAKMTELKDNESALKVTTYINSLPSASAITFANKANVTYARTQFNSLTTKQKALVLNLSKLIDAEAQIAELEVDVKVLINEINNLPSASNITLKHETMIQTLRAAYNKLSNVQKLEVTNYSKLVEVEAQVAKLKAEETKNVPEDLVDAVKTSSGIEAIKKDTKAHTLAITSKGIASEIELSFSKEFIQAMKTTDVETVIIKSTGGVSLEIPRVMFDEGVSKNARLTVQTETVQQGNRTALQVNMTETLPNGIKRDITLPQDYVKITLPLSTFSSARNTSKGVILRVEDGEYRAVPHQIKNGEVFIYANTNDQYVYTTETVTFKDIAGLGNKEDVEFLAERRIVNGTTAATYNPYKSITRAEFGVMIARALNLVALDESIHKDTKGAWYEREIQALYEAGITDVTGNFNPNATLTREQAAAFMYRVIQYIEKDTNSTSNKVSYKDKAQISQHFIDAIAALGDLSIMEGKADGNFDPKGNLTRAQMAKILKRTLQEVNMM